MTLDARPVVLVGDGSRARAWLDVVERSPRLTLVGQVLRPGREGAHPALFPSVATALEALPDASFLVALPARSGLDAALALAHAGRHAVVEMPVDLSLSDLTLPPGAESVGAAFGWVSLSGRRLAQQVLAKLPIERVAVEIRGLPEATAGDVDEVLVHALALLHSLCPGARLIESAREDVGLVTVRAVDGSRQIALRVLTAGAQLHVRLEGRGRSVDWSLEDGVESFAMSEKQGPLPAARAVRSGAERAVAQLLSPDSGLSLVDAQRVARQARDVLASFGERLPPGRRRLEQAAALLERRPQEVLAQLGFEGDLPEAPPAKLLPQVSTPEEIWAFRAGLKPVAFLTVRPEEVEQVLAGYGQVHVQRRDRQVFVGAQDRWVDERDLGEARAELYVSKDAALAARAADVQSLSDPSAQLRQLGALMGYPPCCVEAFALQDDRANNTRNRYATAARTSREAWPWVLNNTVFMSVPFFPCRYDCEQAVRWATATFEAFSGGEPDAAQVLRQVLSRPVLYFDHARQLVFDGAVEQGEVRYRSVEVGPFADEPFTRFAGAVALGDRLTFDEGWLRVWREKRLVMALRRTDPALGFLAPFA